MGLKVLMISRPTLFSVPGGDTVQIQETAAELRKRGVGVTIGLADETMNYSDFDLIHFFNVIRPNAILPHVRKSRLPYVVSTIFVDYSEIERKHRSLPFRILSRVVGADGLQYLKTLGRAVNNGESVIDAGYVIRGHRRSVERVLNGAALLLPNSHNEFTRLEKRYSFENDYRAIPNAVGEDLFASEPANERHGVACVARIEFIKNQLNLIRALKESDIELTLVGKPAPNHGAYYQACKSEAGDNVQFSGQRSKAEVKALLSQARVHVLPSFFETTGLSSLEAAALGCNVVITDKGDTREYFGDYAFYCDPDRPESIRAAIQAALAQPVNPKLRDHIRTHFRWSIAAEKTLEAYREALGAVGRNEQISRDT